MQRLTQESPPLVPPLGPRVGKEQKSARKGGLGQDLEQQAGIVGEDPHITLFAFLQKGEQIRDTVEERLAADIAHIRVGGGLSGQMLAAAKADLEADRPDVRIEKR